MQVSIVVDMTSESIERQFEILRKCTKFSEEIKEGFDIQEGFQSDGKVRQSGLCVVEPKKYRQFLGMGWYEFSRFMKDWIDFHMDDLELTPAQVERMFKTPVDMYQRGHNLQKKR